MRQSLENCCSASKDFLQGEEEEEEEEKEEEVEEEEEARVKEVKIDRKEGALTITLLPSYS